MPNFIQRLLKGADEGLPGYVGEVGYVETDYPNSIQLEPPRETFAVEKLHGVVSGTLNKLRDDEKRLVDDINYQMEKLRQVRVSIRAVESAYVVLDADMQNPAAQPPMPQI